MDKIVIEVVGNAQGVKPVIDDLEKLGAVDKKNADQFRKHNDDFKRAASERKKRIDEETQDLAELEKASVIGCNTGGPANLGGREFLVVKFFQPAFTLSCKLNLSVFSDFKAFV